MILTPVDAGNSRVMGEAHIQRIMDGKVMEVDLHEVAIQII